MSEPTREERIEAAVEALAPYLGAPSQARAVAEQEILEAAGFDSLLAERDRLREAVRFLIERIDIVGAVSYAHPAVTAVRAVLSEGPGGSPGSNDP